MSFRKVSAAIAWSIIMIAPFQNLFAQTDGVLIDYVGNSREPKAILQVNSTEQGAILPRMTAAQRVAILPSATAKGMTVYQTDSPQGYYYWDGTQWLMLASSTGSGYIENLPVTNNFGTGQAASFDITGNGEISGTLAVNGNVGIGTLSPGAKLHVNGGDIRLNDVANVAGYTLKSYSTGTSLWLLSGNASNTQIVLSTSAHDWDRQVALTYDPGTTGAATGDLQIGQISKNHTNWTHGITRFFTNGAERMRINATGDVGIGVSPSYKLDVAGDINSTTGFRIAGTAPVTTYLRGDGNRFVSSAIQEADLPTITTAGGWTDDGTAVRLTTVTDNVGIGTATPGWKLDVNGNARIGANTGQNTFAALAVSAGEGTATTYRDIDLHGAWSANEGHAITASHATGAGNIVGQIVFEHNSPGSRIKFGRLYDSGDQTTYPMELVSNGSNAILRMNTDAYTYYGPNSTWGASLQVGGNGRVTTGASVTTTNGNLHLDAADGAYATYINWYSANPTYINGGAGNVGIGNSGPAVKLHVTGNAFFDLPTGGAALENSLTIKKNGQGQISFGSYPGNWTPALQIQNNDNTRYLWISPLDNASGGNARLVTIGTDFEILPGNTLASTFYSSGDVTTARYHNAQYFNSSDNSVASGVSGIMVKAGDNYFRTGTAAAVATFLNGTTTGPWIPNNGSGDWQIASSSGATGYSNSSLELRETNFGGGGQQPPRLGFHWGGVVASQIAIESSGRIAIRDNPGTGYENFVARDMYADADIYVNNWVRHNDNDGTYWSNNGWHIYPKDAADMRFRTGGGNGGIVGTIGDETPRGYIHWTTGNEIGFLNSGRGWSLRVDNANNSFHYGSSRAPIFYDLDNTGYYGDFAGHSEMNEVYDNVHLTRSTTYTSYSTGSTYAGWAQPWGYCSSCWAGTDCYWCGETYYLYVRTPGAMEAGAYFTASDEKLKKNITSIPNALNTIMQLRGVTYNRKLDLSESDDQEVTDQPNRIRTQLGFVAQEVQEVLPQLVQKIEDDDPEGQKHYGESHLSVQYQGVIPVLVEAMKEQQVLIEDLQKEVKLLSSALANATGVNILEMKLSTEVLKAIQKLEEIKREVNPETSIHIDGLITKMKKSNSIEPMATELILKFKSREQSE